MAMAQDPRASGPSPPPGRFAVREGEAPVPGDGEDQQGRVPGALQRTQLAAQAHEGPAFLLRDAQVRTRPSPAPLRLLLGSAGPDLLRVSILKRRGPPLAQALTLTLAPVLSATALARAMAGRGVPEGLLPDAAPGADALQAALRARSAA